MKTNLTPVTAEQIEACTRKVESGKVFYTVQSASGEGEYTVRHNPAYKVLSCNCKAGREGNNCWHKNAVLAAEQEFQTERRINRDADLKAEGEAEAAIAAYVSQGIDLETATRVVYAPAAEPGPKGSLGYNRGFSLLK